MTDSAAAWLQLSLPFRVALRRDRWVVRAVAALVTLLVLAPLLAPGYVLSYDMVFVPHQPLRWELIAPAGGLPRAVPQDAVVSVLNLLAPGWLVERAALVAILFSAGVGAGRLVPAKRLLTRVVATVGYAWTPFLAERLLIGQWGLLLAYAALPWLVRAAIGVRAGIPGSLPRLIVAAAVCAITPTGGLIAAATTAVVAVELNRARWRASVAAVGATVLLNAPWLVASMVTVASGQSDPAGVAAFAARGENWSGAIGALLGTGGIWNAQTTPTSRSSVLVPLMTVLLLVLAAAGGTQLRRRWPGGAAARLTIVAVIGVAIAGLGVVPVTAELLGWAVSRIPGAGLLRDGHKFVAPYALVLVLSASLGVERLAARLAPARARLVLIAAVILPVAVLPDLAFGGGGALRPVSYPPDWAHVAAIVDKAPGDVLCLPFSEYRRYPWNADRIVIDPAPRFLPADVLSDDTLRVGTLVVVGESPRAAAVRKLLATGAPVAATGVRWVVVQHDAGGVIPVGSLAGLRASYQGPVLDLYENPAAFAAQPASPVRRWLLVMVDLLAVLLLGAAVWCLRTTPTAW